MGIYVNIRETQPAPAPVRQGTANVIMIGYDGSNSGIFKTLSAPVSNTGLTTKRAMMITSYDEFESAYSGTIKDTPLSKAVYDYYNEEAGLGVDKAVLWLYRFLNTDASVTFTDQAALPAGDVDTWRTEVGPVSSITTVKVSYGGAAPVTQDASGYTQETDADTGLKTGKFTFKAAYPKNGDDVQTDIDPNEDIVYVTYETAGITAALRTLRKKDAQFAMFCYDHGKMTGSTPATGIYGGTSLVNDMKILIGYCNQCVSSGYYRQGIISLPAAKHKPSDSNADYGGAETWASLRESHLGNTRNAIVVGFNQSVATSGIYLGSFDGAAVMAAMIRKCAVGENVGFTVPTTAITAYEDDSTQLSFKAARIGTIVKESNKLDGSWLNFGYTLGVSYQRWINNVRARYQIKQLIDIRLLQQMVAKKIPYNLEGAYNIMSTITAAVETARQNGWCYGLADQDPITIPIMEYMLKTRRNASEQAQVDAAAESGIWDNISVTYKGIRNTEMISISALSEES